MKDLRPQTPSQPDNWLHDGAQDYTRVFSKLIYLGKDAEPWAECTDAVMRQWKEEHSEPELPEEQ